MSQSAFWYLALRLLKFGTCVVHYVRVRLQIYIVFSQLRTKISSRNYKVTCLNKLDKHEKLKQVKAGNRVSNHRVSFPMAQLEILQNKPYL